MSPGARLILQPPSTAMRTTAPLISTSVAAHAMSAVPLHGEPRRPPSRLPFGQEALPHVDEYPIRGEAESLDHPPSEDLRVELLRPLQVRDGYLHVDDGVYHAWIKGLCAGEAYQPSAVTCPRGHVVPCSTERRTSEKNSLLARQMGQTYGGSSLKTT